ncbi:hypothetical protein BT93_C0730 [Corymbia citriodora subsp. variegata]|nr:hypothetical protein BT93_C0730 [Corymbia citriodora subsp. variegata]
MPNLISGAEVTNVQAIRFSPRRLSQTSCTLPIRAYVPLGIAMLRSKGTSTFPLACTFVSAALFTFRNHHHFSTRTELEALRKVKFRITFSYPRRW